jgi:hypothetical protein
MANLPLQIPPIPVAAGAPPELELPPELGALPPQPLEPEMAAWGWVPDQWRPDGLPPPVVDELAGAPAPVLPPAPQEPPPEVDAVSAAAPVVPTSPQPAAAPIDPYAPPPAAPAPPARPSTGDAFLDTMGDVAEVRARAAVDKAEAEKEKNAYLADEGARIARENSEKRAAADQEYAEVQAEAKTERTAIEAEAKAIANTKMDANRAWNNMSFGQQLFVGITAALNGWVDPKGPNKVSAMIQQMVDRDLELQKQDLDNRRAGLVTRRGLLADGLAQGRDALDVRYKAMNAGYEMAANQLKATALKFDNPLIDARTNEQLADIAEAQAKGTVAYTQAKEQQIYARRQQELENRRADSANALGWARLREEKRSSRAAEKAKDAAKDAASAGVPIFGAGGPKAGPVGYAKNKEAATEAEVKLQAQGELRDLYEEGLRLFEDDYAIKGTQRRIAQDAWNAKWKNANFRAATGRSDAPAAQELEPFGLDTSAMIGDHKDRLNASYNTARTGLPGRLRALGVDDATLAAQGIVDPPPAPTPGHTDILVHYDEKTQTYNTMGRGTPLSPERSAQIRSDPNYAVDTGGSGHGIWYDAKTKTYNVKGIGERLSPDAERQVREQPDKFPVVR